MKSLGDRLGRWGKSKAGKSLRLDNRKNKETHAVSYISGYRIVNSRHSTWYWGPR